MILKVFATVLLTGIAGVIGLVVAWPLGYVSRQVAVQRSPDGAVEAVCRGRLPESTEYDLWLRRPGEVFGRRLGQVGTESMGRCRAVVWSPTGDKVATLSEGGQLGVFDAIGRPVGTQWLVKPLGSYPMERIVLHARFESADAVAFAHCARLWHTTRRPEDMFRCGPETIQARTLLQLEPPRGFFGR